MAEVALKQCSICGTSFSCGGNCWCKDFPAIMPMDVTSDCLCKSCLSASITKKIHEYVKDLTPDKIEAIQSLGAPTSLNEGIDYTINESGNWVFSSWYLLRQGKCCNNNCKNCPYPK